MRGFLFWKNQCTVSEPYLLLLISSGSAIEFLGCRLWNSLIFSLAFSKSIQDCHAGAAFHSSQLLIYIALYWILYLFVLRQLIISNTFYILYILLLLFWINIEDSDSKTWPGNRLLGAKYSFHRWKIGMRLASFMCWEISSLYALLSMILLIFQNSTFLILSNFFDFFNAKYLTST